MKPLASLLLATLLAAGISPAQAETRTLNFEGTDNGLFLPLAGYGGFTWTFAQGGAIHGISSIDVPAWLPASLTGYYAGVGCVPGIPNPAGCTGAFNIDRATPTAVTRSEPFILDRVDLTSAVGQQTIELSGRKAGQLKLSYSLTIGESRQTLDLDWRDIDEFRLATAPNSHPWIMDNLTYTVPVPEPSTWVQLLAGLGLVAALSRRRITAARRAIARS